MLSLRRFHYFFAVAIALLVAIAPASAQTSSDRRGIGPGWGPGMMMGPGMMRGPGMWGQSGFGELCSPRMAGFAEWRIEQIERAVKPNESQRKLLEDLRAASTKAAETITAACPRDIPPTAPARLALMEGRMEAMLQAVKTVRPAFDAFYGALSDAQKARLDATGPRRWGWSRWRQSGL
jgi:hypothetical protein